MFSQNVNSWTQTRIEVPVSVSPCYRSFSCFLVWPHCKVPQMEYDDESNGLCNYVQCYWYTYNKYRQCRFIAAIWPRGASFLSCSLHALYILIKHWIDSPLSVKRKHTWVVDVSCRVAICFLCADASRYKSILSFTERISWDICPLQVVGVAIQVRSFRRGCVTVDMARYYTVEGNLL